MIARTLTKGERFDGDTETFIANTLKAHNGKGGSGISPEDTFIAAPLTKGSASGDGVNAPGRRQEDNVNLVTFVSGASDPVNADNIALTSTKRHGDPGMIAIGASVRRLTPRECERLQGLPDDWTLLSEKTPDSRRYAALGDAVTSSVAEWIGRRIAATGAVSRSYTT